MKSEKEASKSKTEILEKELDALKNKICDLEKTLAKFTKGKENLDTLLGN